MTNTNYPNGDEAARAYWASQMEMGFDFMEKMRIYPLNECAEGMASIREAVAGLKVEFSRSLFLNDRYPRIFYIRSGLCGSLRRVAQEMNERGWILKVEDGYRTPAMQRAASHSHSLFDAILRKVIWELGGTTPTAEFLHRRMTALIAMRCRVGTHISGSAMDISVIDQNTGGEIGCGGPYPEISERTPWDSPFVTKEERAHRNEIAAIFLRHRWFAYPYEFWHFSSGDSYAEFLSGSGKPARYGPIIFENGATHPIGAVESDALLEPVEFYRSQISAALARIKK